MWRVFIGKLTYQVVLIFNLDMVIYWVQYYSVVLKINLWAKCMVGRSLHSSCLVKGMNNQKDQ